MLRTRLSMIALVTTALFAASCSDDDKGQSSSFKLDGAKESLKTAVLWADTEPRNPDADPLIYDHELALLSAGFTLSEEGILDGTGNVLDFSISAPDASGLAVGTYQYSEQGEDAAFYFTYSSLYADYSTETEGGAQWEIVSGTLTVSKSGSTYTISFEGTAKLDGIGEAKSLTAHFHGPLSAFED